MMIERIIISVFTLVSKLVFIFLFMRLEFFVTTAKGRQRLYIEIVRDSLHV